jgi:hypothetical protein
MCLLANEIKQIADRQRYVSRRAMNKMNPFEMKVMLILAVVGKVLKFCEFD